MSRSEDVQTEINAAALSMWLTEQVTCAPSEHKDAIREIKNTFDNSNHFDELGIIQKVLHILGED